MARNSREKATSRSKCKSVPSAIEYGNKIEPFHINPCSCISVKAVLVVYVVVIIYV